MPFLARSERDKRNPNCIVVVLKSVIVHNTFTCAFREQEKRERVRVKPLLVVCVSNKQRVSVYQIGLTVRKRLSGGRICVRQRRG